MWGGVRIFAVGAALVVGGCSVVGSYRFAGSDAIEPEPQRAGSYFLPKHVLRIVVKENNGKRTIAVSSEAVPDRKALVQVGFNLSAFADDDVKVEYETNGLLKGIAATNTDKTGEIFVQLVKTAAGFRATAAEQEAAVGIYEFDPFDWQEASYINKLLAPYGCVEVELRPGYWSPGCRARARQDSYNKATLSEAMQLDQVLSIPPSVPGIYFRRPIAHRVIVYQDKKAKQYLSVEFANAAPIFRIDVDRTAFVERKTVIEFVNGTPKTVQVTKKSEALAAAELPLKVVKAIISAPVEAISEHKNEQNARAELYKSEAARIEAENKLVALGGTPRSAARSATLSDFRDRSAISEPGVTAADCRTVGLTDPQDCLAALGR